MDGRIGGRGKKVASNSMAFSRLVLVMRLGQLGVGVMSDGILALVQSEGELMTYLLVMYMSLAEASSSQLAQCTLLVSLILWQSLLEASLYWVWTGSSGRPCSL